MKKRAKIITVIIILVAVIAVSAFLYLKYFGKGILENALSDILGHRIKFEKISFDIKNYAADFRGFTIVDELDFSRAILNAGEFKVTLNRERFENDRTIAVEKVFIKKAVLNISRSGSGVYNVSRATRKEEGYDSSLAYAEDYSGNALYNFARTIKEVTIEDSTINYYDNYVSSAPYGVVLDSLNLNIRSRRETDYAGGPISVECGLTGRIPNDRYRDGTFSLSGVLAVYPDRVDMNIRAETQYIDLMQFAPYFDRYTPFSFRDGLFSSVTKFEAHNNVIRSLTEMRFHVLRFYIDPGMQNAQFLNTTINRLVPYLTSGAGEVLFDFVIEGPTNHPQTGIGPQVKYAMGMVAAEELGKILQQLSK